MWDYHLRETLGDKDKMHSAAVKRGGQKTIFQVSTGLKKK